MPAIRIALIGIGVALWVPLAIIVGCRGGMCGHAWDSPPGSLRHELYELLAAHRVLVAVTFFAYGVATIIVFRREIIAAVTTVAVLRVLGLIAVAIAVTGVGVLLTRL